MDWLLTNPQIISTFSSLGFLKDDVYEISPDALAILEEINLKLIYEDQTLRTFRRSIGFGQHVKADLIPLLINAKDPDIADAVIRILVNLTVPVECLFCVDIMYRTEVGRNTIFELNKLLITSKEAFSDPKSTKSILDRIKAIIEGESKKLSGAQCDNINNCLLLLRNILHIPENSLTGPHSSNNTSGGNGGQTSLQNSILWNLFIQSIDKTLLYLMSCPQRAHWVVTMVQLIALMYKDQHVGTLQKLLNLWFDASLSESSDDNESNTTPPKKGSGDSSPMLTSSDPTSDSSDNGGSVNKESSEDRRQTNFNKETEATLQEVSRKGHEYQEAMMRIPVNKHKKEQQPKLINHQNEQSHHETSIQNNTMKKFSSIESSSRQQHQRTFSHAPDSPTSPLLIQKSKPADQENTSEAIFIPPPPKSKIETCKNHPGNPPQAIKSPHSGILCNGKCPAQKRECPSSTSELSDCGYGTQVENVESISTSSNEDESPQQKPIHQKPHSNQKQRPKQHPTVSLLEKKEWRRKKLVKRSKSNLINMKGLIQHTPTDEDITNILKEFTVDFLLKGYGYLVQELHAQLLEELFPMDTSHFFWLITYFLKFASQLELDLEHINTVLNYDILSYLVFEGALLGEQLELASRQEGGDLKPFLRRMHLAVTAIREFIQALETYKKITHLTQEDRQYLRNLSLQVCATDDLRSLFLLLIRKFNPMWNSRQYLQDIISTNHDLLVLLDHKTKSEDKSLISFNITDHISQFAHVEIIYHYALLLDDFRENGEFINDCIFTMMHHIGADLEQVQLLYQPLVLKTFSQIWESEFEVCDDWSDLIEYVIHRFMNSPRNNSFMVSCGSLTEMTKEHNMEHSVETWNQEEKDILYWHYVQSKKVKDIVGRIRQLYKENGNSEKTRLSIIQQLLQQDVITLVEYDDLMRLEDSDYEKNLKKREPSTSTSESGIDLRDSVVAASNVSKNQSMDNVQYLISLLIKDGKAKIVQWLQRVLLECCYVKLSIDFGKIDPTSTTDDDAVKVRVMESIPYHSMLRKKSIPLVPWSTEQSNAMTHKPFILLLHKLGFHLPVDAGSIFARVPEFWTADIMFNIAQKLGNIEKNMIKFDTNLLNNMDHQQSSETMSHLNPSNNEMQWTDLDKMNQKFSVPNVKQSNSIIRFTPEPAPTPSVPNWLQLVMKSKCNYNTSSNSNENGSNHSSNTANNNLNLRTSGNISSSKVLEAIADIENHRVTILEEDEDEHLAEEQRILEAEFILKQEQIEEESKINRENNEENIINIKQENYETRDLKREIEDQLRENRIKEESKEIKIEDENEKYRNITQILNKDETTRTTTTITETVNVLNIAVSNAFSEIKTEQTTTTSSFIIPIKKRNPMLTHLKQQSSEDDSLMKSIDRDDSSGYQTRRGSHMDSEFMKSIDRDDSSGYPSRRGSQMDTDLMKSIDRDDSSGYQTRRGSQMDTEFQITNVTSALDNEYLNNVSSAETDSISSDLTRMYVSDEEHIQ